MSFSPLPSKSHNKQTQRKLGWAAKWSWRGTLSGAQGKVPGRPRVWRGGEDLWRSGTWGRERHGNPNRERSARRPRGGMGQGQGHDGTDRTRPRPSLGQERAEPGQHQGRGGKHQSGPGSGREERSGIAGEMKRTRGDQSRGGKHQAGPRPPGREESGERRRPYLSEAGHVRGGQSRGHGSRSPRSPA